MNPTQVATYRFAAAIRGMVDDTGDTRSHNERIESLRRYLGEQRLLADEVWQAAKRPWATGPDGWTDRESNREAFWAIASELEDPDAPGILKGSTQTP